MFISFSPGSLLNYWLSYWTYSTYYLVTGCGLCLCVFNHHISLNTWIVLIKGSLSWSNRAMGVCLTTKAGNHWYSCHLLFIYMYIPLLLLSMLTIYCFLFTWCFQMIWAYYSGISILQYTFSQAELHPGVQAQYTLGWASLSLDSYIVWEYVIISNWRITIEENAVVLTHADTESKFSLL